jgi:hypothetical protein
VSISTPPQMNPLIQDERPYGTTEQTNRLRRTARTRKVALSTPACRCLTCHSWRVNTPSRSRLYDSDPTAKRCMASTKSPSETCRVVARPSHPLTSTRFDRAGHNLDRHASYIVTATLPVPPIGRPVVSQPRRPPTALLARPSRGDTGRYRTVRRERPCRWTADLTFERA